MGMLSIFKKREFHCNLFNASSLIARGVCLCFFLTLLTPVHAETLKKALEAYDFKEYEDAAQWLRPWADSGQVEAQYRLGVLYENGQGVAKSLEEAKRWYRKAAEQNYARARRRLESLGDKSAGPVSESVALKWYQDLADQGEPDAQYNLGFIYETGFSVPKDDGKAAHWYEEAGEKKNIPAQLRLGLLYLAGAGVKQSEIQAAKWLQAAGKQGNKLASSINDQLLSGSSDLLINKVELAERIRSASAKDEKKAIAILTEAVTAARTKMVDEKAARDTLLVKRKGIQSALEQDSSIEFGLDAEGRRTLSWYQRSAERGLASAQFQLGKYYETGQQTPSDTKEAMRWYRSAAEQGYADAQYYLGMLYYYGIGIDREKVLAKSLMEASASQGHASAKRMLSRVSDDTLPDPESMAVWWLMRSGQSQDGLALRHLGSLYELGRGVSADTNEARKHYQASSSLGFNAGSQSPVPSSQRVIASAPVKRETVDVTDTSAGVSRALEAARPGAPVPIAQSLQSSDVVDAIWAKYLPFVLIAILPVSAFAWFVMKEKKRAVKGGRAASMRKAVPVVRPTRQKVAPSARAAPTAKTAPVATTGAAPQKAASPARVSRTANAKVRNPFS